MRVRVKKPPMSGKYARPTLAAYAKSICYSVPPAKQDREAGETPALHCKRSALRLAVTIQRVIRLGLLRLSQTTADGKYLSRKCHIPGKACIFEYGRFREEGSAYPPWAG
jgi:hypothetical protein